MSDIDERIENWMDTVFTGNTTTEQNECVTMRLGLPWSFDIDTFGICSCIYTLIHGVRFEIETMIDQSGSKRWMPKLKTPRHFQKELWTEIFDTLLNIDEDFGQAIGSRPYNLKRLRKKIEDCLNCGGNQALLDASFQYQRSILSESHR
jgi:hypothetical protein